MFYNADILEISFKVIWSMNIKAFTNAIWNKVFVVLKTKFQTPNVIIFYGALQHFWAGLLIWIVDSAFVTSFSVKIVLRIVHKAFREKLRFFNIKTIFIFFVFLRIHFHNIWKFLRVFSNITIFNRINRSVLSLPFKRMI